MSERIEELLALVAFEVERQDAKHGPYGSQGGTPLGISRLAIATLEDEVREVLQAWRDERKTPHWDETRTEVIQVAAVCVRTLRDALAPSSLPTTTTTPDTPEATP